METVRSWGNSASACSRVSSGLKSTGDLRDERVEFVADRTETLQAIMGLAIGVFVLGVEWMHFMR